LDPTVASLSQILEVLHDDLIKAVDPLDDDEINWAHPHLSNTIGILLRHVAGSERYWIGEVVGGRAMHRQREQEFTKEPLRKVPLVEDLRRAHAEVQAVLRGLHDADLAAPVEVTYRGGRRTFTRGWAIANSLQHTAYHLGQVQLYKKMAKMATP